MQIGFAYFIDIQLFIVLFNNILYYNLNNLKDKLNKNARKVVFNKKNFIFALR